ncbi:MAG: molybdopterin-guanine dinucleotide biosynthesis protein MobB [Spirochaetales bacterium]|nr:molybdopterin-guanine dinucleotide biosynthesis protein MobB [Spirochaetales bacterium]
MSPRVICFTGWSDTGKSGFITACSAELHARGVSVAAIKSVRHDGSFNLPGKDSTRFFDACGQSALVSTVETHVLRRTPESWNRDYATSLFPDAGSIFIEGHDVEGALRVLVGGAATDEAQLKRPLAGFDALISDHQDLAGRARAAGLEVFGSGEAKAFIERYCAEGSTMEERNLTITMGGNELPINPFVKETIENVVLAMLKPLKKIDLSGEIVLTIGPEKK